MDLFITFIKAFVVFKLVLGLASLCTWIERKGSAMLQDRIGANRAGTFISAPNGLCRPLYCVLHGLGVLGVINTLVCDPVKAIFKEDFVPEGTHNLIHCLAPFMAVFPVFLAYAFVPFAPDFEVMGRTIRPQVAGLDAGILYIFAFGSLAVYGPAIAGWCSNNKFALLGGIRATAQMISYELAMGLAFVSVILTYGTLDLYVMVEAQRDMWGIFMQPLAMVVLFIVGMAETKRNPFDLPEAESEIVAGYFTEYSGMKFLLFWMGEFAEIALFSLLFSVLFFGGWDIPFITLPQGAWWAALLGHVALMVKVVFFCVLQIIIRWSLPRFRYDQLMRLGWKILLPVSLANLVVTAAVKLLV